MLRRAVNRTLTMPWQPSWQPSQSIAAEPELEPAAAKKAARCHARAAFFLGGRISFGGRSIWKQRVPHNHGVDDGGTAGRLRTTKRAAALTTTQLSPILTTVKYLKACPG